MKIRAKIKKHRVDRDTEIPLKKKIRREEEEEESLSKMGGKDWMMTDPEEVRKAQRRSEAEAKRSRRPPELWVPPDESKRLRFLQSQPIAAIWRYRMKVNGRWIAVTAPGAGEPDLMRKAGLRPQLVHLYPVIDIDGYVDKNTKKKMRNIPRFLPVSGRVEKQINKIREKKGGLTKYPMEYCRSGGGIDTTYNFLLEDKAPMPAEYAGLMKPLLKDFEGYYSPPTVDEQRLMLSGVSTEEDEDSSASRRSSSREERESF